MTSPPASPPAAPRAALFDLLTALIDSWSLWNEAAGSETAGRAWRAQYLRLTYGCGAYQPYELLVRQAAEQSGLTPKAADALEAGWDRLPVWSGAAQALARLQGRVQLGIVTNCSMALGQRAAARLDVPWDVVITAEEAGHYKPDPHPYRLALQRLGVAPDQACFVAGSGYDLFGTQAVGLRTYWHNRIYLARPAGAPPAEIERDSLDELPAWVLRGAA